MSFLGGGRGGGSTTVQTTVSVPPPSEEERALQKKQVELLELQVGEARRQSQLLEQSFPQSAALLQAQLQLTQDLVASQRRGLDIQERALLRQEKGEEEAAARGARLEGLLGEIAPTETGKEIQRLSEQRTLAQLRGEAPSISPQEEQFIEEQFSAAATEAKGAVRQFAEELAASRGLRLTDSPIGGEALRVGGDIATRLAGAKAQSKLQAGEAQRLFQEQISQFQSQLRQQAFQNRLTLLGRQAPTSALLGGIATPGLGLGATGAPSLLVNAPGVIQGSIAGLSPILSGLRQERFAAAPTTQFSRTTGGPGPDFLGAGTQLASSALIAFGLRSSLKFKKDVEPLDRSEYAKALSKVRKTPVVRFRYKWDDAESHPRTGIILETSPPELSRDGQTVDLLSYAGLQLAALKGLDRKVQRLERRH